MAHELGHTLCQEHDFYGSASASCPQSGYIMTMAINYNAPAPTQWSACANTYFGYFFYGGGPYQPVSSAYTSRNNKCLDNSEYLLLSLPLPSQDH